MKRCGITVVELIVVVLLLSLLMMPVVYVFRFGSRTALQGMMKSDITIEARAVLRQVQDDLKYSVFVIDYTKRMQENTHDFFDRIVTSTDGSVYSLLRFPLKGAVSEAIKADSGGATRIPVRITYTLSRADAVFYTLYRREGNGPPAILSQRVNFFEIRENPAAPAKTSWLVTLQLAEQTGPLAETWTPEMSGTPPTAAARATARRLEGRSRNVQIADFFAVVASEYYSRFRRSRAVPNWHTLIGSP